MRILMFGTFDHLHPGHKHILRLALERAGEEGEVWVAVARDATVERIKKRPPLQSEQERADAIKQAFPAINVMLGSENKDYLFPVRTVQPDLILLGYDQKMPPGITEEDLGCPVERLSAYEPHIHKSSLYRAQEKQRDKARN